MTARPWPQCDALPLADANHGQPGDPSKLAQAFLGLINADNPPRLPLGSDTLQRIEQKSRFVEAELAQWRGFALSTDFAG